MPDPSATTRTAWAIFSGRVRVVEADRLSRKIVLQIGRVANYLGKFHEHGFLLAVTSGSRIRQSNATGGSFFSTIANPVFYIDRTGTISHT